MALSAGRYTLGPGNGTLSVRTRKGGAIAKAGHNLLLRVTAWNATVDVGADGVPSSIELTADSASMQVIEGSGGIKALDDEEKAGIAQTINEEVLNATSISFRSSAITADADAERLSVAGELELLGRRHPVSFDLRVPNGRITGSATIKQSEWGITPYTALFGTLKVLDEVTVEVDAQLPEPAAATAGTS